MKNKFLHLLLSILFVVAMSQSGLDTMSKITGTHLLFGTYDYQPDCSNVFIHAYGFKKNNDVEVFCWWVNGMPKIIHIKERPRTKHNI